MLSKRHHELKISYLKHRLANMPQGYFGMHRGFKAIYVTYDPMNKEITKQHKRIIRIDSKIGKMMQPVIAESMKLNGELELLTAYWNATYCEKPREIHYPLQKKRRPMFNSAYFNKARSNANNYRREELKIEYKGQWFRTKNEVSAAQVIDSMGYEFKSEINVVVPGSEYDHYPDLSFDVKELDVMLMSEIDGKLDKGNYRLKSMERQYEYFEDGFREFRDIVFMRLAEPSVFDPTLYRMLVEVAIEANIDDIEM